MITAGVAPVLAVPRLVGAGPQARRVWTAAENAQHAARRDQLLRENEQYVLLTLTY